MWTTLATKRRNYMRISSRPSPRSHHISPSHAFKVHASAAMFMYASFASSVSHGIRSACTPFFAC